MERSTSRLVLAIGFAGTAALSLSIHGCVRGPHKISSTLPENVSGADEPLPHGEEDAQTARFADTEGPLLASETETRFHPIVRVSHAVSRQAEATSEGLLGTLLKRRRREQNFDAAQGDPFLVSAEAAAKPTAAGPPGTPGDQSPTEQGRATNAEAGTVRFTKDFDARLARLREELNELDEQATAATESPKSGSARPDWALTPETTQPSLSQRPHGASASVAEMALTPPQQAETVVAGTSSTATEDDTDRPTETIRRTSQEGETGSDRAKSSASATALWGEKEQVARNAGWTDSPGNEDVELVHATEAAAAPEEPLVSDGGVRLLAPIDDSVPAASDERFERIRTGTMHRGRPETDFMSGFTWPDEPGPAGHLSVLKHAESTKPPVMDVGARVSREISLLAGDGSSSRFSNVGPRRVRSVESRSADNWLTPTASTTRETAAEDCQPVQVAAAPPLLLESEAVASPERQRGAGNNATGNNKRVRSRWASQMPWFIGGLILLLAAMRLISRKTPSRTAAM